MDSQTTITLSKEVWVALITFVAAPLAASVAANLSLKGAVQALTERVTRLELKTSRRRSVAPARARK